MSDVPNWRDDVARAAAKKDERAEDEETVSQARGLVDRWLSLTRWSLAISVALGLPAGWLATSVLLHPAAGQVHTEWALRVVVCAWGLLLARGLIVLWISRRSLILEGFPWIYSCLRTWLASISPLRGATPEQLSRATANETYGVLVAAKIWRPLSAAAAGAFWTVYAVGALLAIWFVTGQDALGFGFGWTWESSTVSLDLRHVVVEFVRAAVEFPAPVLGCIGSDGLMPVAPAPVTPDNPEMLAVRRSWVCVLTAIVGAYLLVPMMLWTLWCGVIARRNWKRWESRRVATIPRFAATPTRKCRSAPVTTALGPPSGVGGACKYVVRLERPGAAVALPAPLDQLDDLGDVDAIADLERRQEIMHNDPGRVVVVSWLPVSPDSGVQDKLRTLANASTAAPLLVLDGGHAFRRVEPDSTVAIRVDEWRTAANQTGVEPFECDLANLTDTNQRDLMRAIGHGEEPDGKHDPATASGSGSTQR